MEPSFPFRRSPRRKGKNHMSEEPIPRAEWNPKSKKIFLESAYDEVRKGNFNKGFLLREGWNNCSTALTIRMKRPYTVLQLKNEWLKLKQEWGIVKKLLKRLTGAGLDEATGTLRQEPQWWQETLAADNRMTAYATQDLRPWRDFAPVLFDASLATGEFSVAPSFYSDTCYEGGTNMVDSDPDLGEGSGDSGEKVPIPPVPFFPLTSSGHGSGSSGKRKSVDLGHCIIPSARRKLPTSDYSMGSGQTTGTSKGQKKETQAERVPTVKECMGLINYLEDTDIDLYANGVELLRDEFNRQVLVAIPSRKGIERWIRNNVK